MPQSEPTGPQDNASRDNFTVEPEHYQIQGVDPVVRWLIVAILAVIILWLVFVVSAIMFGAVLPPKSPRTATERDLSLLQEQVQSGAADTQTWARYIDVLVTAGQLDKARDTVNTALVQAKTDKSFILAEQARLDFVARDYAHAIQSADQAIAMAVSEYQDQVKANSARKITQGTQMPESWGLAVLTKAQALAASGDNAGAIKALDVYLAKNRIDSDILVRRADLKAQIGDTAGARADYNAALKYIPDYKPALDGLTKIGAGAK